MMLLVITICWIVISTICLWVLIEQRKKPIFLFFFIPAFLFLTTSTFFTVKGLLGYPTTDLPKTKFTYLAHLSNEPISIYYWLMVHGEEQPRAFIFPYTKKDKENADKAENLSGLGIYVEGELAADGGNGEEGGEEGMGGFTPGGALEFYLFDHVINMPKDITEEE